MEGAGASLPFSNANKHRNNEKTDRKIWPVTETKSDLVPFMFQTSMPTVSNSDPELKLMQNVGESVFQLSPNQSNLHYQNHREPIHLNQFQSSKQHMSTTMTSERRKASTPSTWPLRPELSGANSVLGSSTGQLDMSGNCQNFAMQNNNDLLQQPRITSDYDSSIKLDYMTSQQNMHQVQRPMQFYHHLGAQNLRNEPSHEMHQNIDETSHSRGLIFGGQLNSNQFHQRMDHHEGSSASGNDVAQNGVLFPKFSEWHDHAYDQLLTMKRLYTTELMRLYQGCQSLSSVQHPNAEYAIKVENFRIGVQKSIKFLNMPKYYIVRFAKEEFYYYLNEITIFMNRIRPTHSVSSQYHQPIAQPQGAPSPAVIGPNRIVTFPGLENVRAGSSYISQKSSFQAIPQDCPRQRAPDLLQPCSTGLLHHNTSSAGFMSSSPNEILGTYGFSTRASPSDSSVFQSQDRRNCEDRQFMQGMEIQQPHQSLIDRHIQRMMVLRTSGNNGPRFQESMSSSPTMFHQPYQATSQHIDHFPQTLLSSSSCQPHVTPQSGQCYYPPVDSNESIGSSFVVPSPSPPLTPSPSLENYVKKPSSHSPSLISGEDYRTRVLFSQNESQALDNKYGSTDMLEVENSHLPHQVDSEEVQEPNAKSGPFKRLLEVLSEDDSESMAGPQSKRLKTKDNAILMKEIKEVNEGLVETVAEIVRNEADEETIVCCSYFPVGQFATSHVEFPGLLLRLLVKRDYPDSSPSVLDIILYNWSETEEVQAIMRKARSNLSLSLQKISEPMSVSMMVKAWDVSTRGVYHEYAKKFGGECFSSRHG